MRKGKKAYGVCVREDLFGKEFGLLKVIGVADERGANGGLLYRCLCRGCNTEITSDAYHLEYGERKTCGDGNCIRILHGKEPDYGDLKYPARTECNGYASDVKCSILTEIMCRTRGRCSFYKNKDEAVENSARA